MKPARIFAPLALVACAVAVLAIVNSNNKSGSGGTSSNPAQTVSTTAKPKKKLRRTYIVKQGDVLSAISIKTGVPIETIMRLNPNVDAQTLSVGQKLKLEP